MMKTRPRTVAMLVLGAISVSTPARGQSFARLEREMKRAVRERVFPGAVVVVGRRDSILYARGFGHLTWDPKSPVPSPARTRYDLASLTKVVGTASVAARLASRGELDLGRSVGSYVPCFRGEARDGVTLAMLLSHRSGLRPWLPLWREAATAAAAFDRVCAEAPAVAPGSATAYSDLNAILLGAALEHATGQPLDTLVAREVVAPLGLHATSFVGATAPPFDVAPTSRDADDVRLGRVHDENAELLGGVSGHAGMFATAMDVARVAQAWLGHPTADGPWLAPEVRGGFVTPPPDGGRPLGWDRPEREGNATSSFGGLSSEATFGHTGWTGTQMWMDPVNDLFVVLLSNRAYRPAHKDTMARMRLVRARVADAALESALPCVRYAARGGTC